MNPHGAAELARTLGQSRSLSSFTSTEGISELLGSHAGQGRAAGLGDHIPNSISWESH